MKKYLLGLFSLFLIFSLFACSSESSKTSIAEDQNEEKSSEDKAKAEADAKAASSERSEIFANCTELRKKYPGVAYDHPAYQDKMGRDKDNFACEN